VAALRALRDIYKNRGVLYDGELAGQIYDSDQAFESLQRITMVAIISKNSTLNELANAIRRVAAKEDIDFPEQVDPVGAENVMREAAGLPLK
jgi:DNA-binding NarL/FixJ family response regulator